MALKVPEVGLIMLEVTMLALDNILLLPELTIVTLGGGVAPLAKPVDKTFWVLCIIKDLAAPALPSVRTFLSMTDELHALSIMSFVVEMLSKSPELAVTTVLILGVVVCNAGFTVVTLNDMPEVTAVRLRMFRDTMALCSMLPVGNDFDVTLTYCTGVALVVRVPKPMIVLAVP